MRTTVRGLLFDLDNTLLDRFTAFKGVAESFYDEHLTARHRDGDPCTTVIPAQAGTQGRGFPATKSTHIRGGRVLGDYASVPDAG